MSAEVESMFYYGETPWHKLGKEVPNTLTAEEAIVAAGLDWDVEKVNIFHNFKGSKVKIENKQAIRRSTDGRILGVMSPHYSPVQNRDAFRFFDSVAGTGEAKYHTAGSLRDGQRIWMLAKLDGKKGPMNIKGDEVDKFLLLLNGHDGVIALKMLFTPVRVVCQNTLTAAEAGAKRIETFYARHLGNIQGKMDVAREILGLSVKFYDTFEEIATRLAMVQLPPGDLPKLLVAAFQTTGAVRAEDAIDFSTFGKKQQGEMERVVALFGGEGKGLDREGIRGTKWAAYNAVVEYVDYAKQFRDVKNAADNRLENIWLSGGQRIKQKAWDFLTKK